MSSVGNFMRTRSHSIFMLRRLMPCDGLRSIAAHVGGVALDSSCKARCNRNATCSSMCYSVRILHIGLYCFGV